MIRGAQKQMIVLRTNGSRFFDEAYFVLRRPMPERRGRVERDMVREANRILNETTGMTGEPAKRQGHKRFRVVFWSFLSGAAVGGLAVLLLFLL